MRFVVPLAAVLEFQSSATMTMCLYLLLVLHITEGCTPGNRDATKYITARTGESVLLPCYCANLHAIPETFTWKKYNTTRNTWEVISSESDQYRDRVQLFNDHSSANLFLLISHLTEEDGQVYMCDVKDGGLTYIQLTVEGCTLNDNKKIKTLTAHTGGSVLLPCYCTDLQTTPERFTWEKYTIRNAWEEISSKSDQYRARVQLVNDHSPGNLSLLISHLTKEDGGEYSCTLKANEYTDIKLTIEVASTPPAMSTPAANGRTASTATFLLSEESRKQHVNPYYFIFAAVGGLLLLIIVGAVIFQRHRAQRRGQMKSHKRKAGWRKDQETQDCSDGLYCTVLSEPTDTSEQERHNRELLYNDDAAQEKDDVTYCTVVHVKSPTPLSTPLDTGDNIEYASIKLS
ncbi:uncharacterized protein [Salminus brasiliensis]|uniref:uncharacterized protein n=1 Tax=Salminus brasiliensis TaxID=930266 RepID=UPI003B83880C